MFLLSHIKDSVPRFVTVYFYYFFYASSVYLTALKCFKKLVPVKSNLPFSYSSFLAMC